MPGEQVSWFSVMLSILHGSLSVSEKGNRDRDRGEGKEGE